MKNNYRGGVGLQMDNKKRNLGYSLIELVVVMAIMAILTGASVSIIQYTTYANTKRCVNELNTTLDKLRADSLGKTDRPYLYVYNCDGTYYMTVTTEETINTSVKRKKLANTKVEFFYTRGGSESKLTDGEYVKIGFTKSLGTYMNGASATDAKYYNNFRIATSSSSTTIEMVELTGKHFITK